MFGLKDLEAGKDLMKLRISQGKFTMFAHSPF